MAKFNLTEEQIAAAGQFYQARKQGYIEKHDPPSRVIRNPKTGALFVQYIKRGYLDFTGHWRGDGTVRIRPIGYGFVIEAKEVTSSPSFRAPSSGKILKREQMQAAIAFAESGGLAFLLINFRVTTKVSTKGGKRRKIQLSADERIEEAYLWRVEPSDPDDPFVKWSRTYENLNLSIGWFRENAVFIDRGDGGLAWGRGIEVYLERMGL